MSNLTQLPNIGSVLEAQLTQIGIATPEGLRAAGSREAWLRIYAIDPSACLSRCWPWRARSAASAGTAWTSR